MSHPISLWLPCGLLSLLSQLLELYCESITE